MMWDEWYDFQQPQEEEEEEESDEDSYVNFDFFSVLSKSKDYYKILEVDYDASEEVIRSNYIRLALKWHPDKQKDEDTATSKFQEINEAYQGSSNSPETHPSSSASIILDFETRRCFNRILSDPVKRREYDKKGMFYSYDSNITDYLNRYKSLILTCNGLGMKCSIW